MLSDVDSSDILMILKDVDAGYEKPYGVGWLSSFARLV